MDAVVKGWVENSLHQSEHEDWRNLASIVAPRKAVEAEGMENVPSTPVFLLSYFLRCDLALRDFLLALGVSRFYTIVRFHYLIFF